MNNVCECWNQCHIVLLRLIFLLEKNYFGKVISKCVCISISVEIFAGLEITGKLSNFLLPLNHQ